MVPVSQVAPESLLCTHERSLTPQDLPHTDKPTTTYCAILLFDKTTLETSHQVDTNYITIAAHTFDAAYINMVMSPANQSFCNLSSRKSTLEVKLLLCKEVVLIRKLELKLSWGG